MTAAASSAGLHLLQFDASPLAQIQLAKLKAHSNMAGSSTPSVVLDDVVVQLDAWFEDPGYTFDLPLAPHGTLFQRAVWDALCEISPGTTLSYKQLAARLGRPTASRAVGSANRLNPIAVIIPCHRVIASTGLLHGYAGPPNTKRRLLEHERALIPELF